jgi:alkylated DNA nucleotide flippase Atl1
MPFFHNSVFGHIARRLLGHNQTRLVGQIMNRLDKRKAPVMAHKVDAVTMGTTPKTMMNNGP